MSGTSGGSTSKNYPAYKDMPKEAQGLVQQLLSQFSGGTATPNANATSLNDTFSQYLKGLPNLMQGNTGVGNMLNQMATTGNPFDTTAEASALNKQYGTDLDKALAQARETSGMTGGLRSSGGEYYMGKAAADTTAAYNVKLQDLIRQGYSEAQARMLAAAPLATSASGANMSLMGTAGDLSSSLDLAKNPQMTNIMNLLAILGKGQAVTTQQGTPTWASILGGVAQGAGTAGTAWALK